MTKADIRNEMLFRRDSLDPKQVEFLGNTILYNLTKAEEYINAEVIYLYASCRNEADTTGFIVKALNDNKRVALPCSYISNGEPYMDFYYINALTDLTSGYKGIKEPDRRKDTIKKAEDVPDIIIVPGVAFDLSLNRIGYGKGFYDRYLSLHNYSADSRKPVLIGLCYSFQTLYEIPADKNDVKMNMLITEKGVIRA